MAVKTRAQLKSENASDFPDNTARLISPADLRGQIDDVVDSALFPEDGVAGMPGTAGDVRFVANIAVMRALPGLAPGSVVFVGNRMEQFICVNDATLGSDGGTVFIPDSELSTVVEEAITPWDYFGIDALRSYPLAHSGVDFESVEWVLSDPNALFPSGETLSIWELHGHLFQPGYVERAEPQNQQYPFINCGPGLIYDWGAFLTWSEPNPLTKVRTGGVLIRYRYATSGLRLKRVVGDEFHFRWWSPVAIDEELGGVEVNNRGRFCWCINAAARAKATRILVDKMYHVAGVVELPDGIEIKGRGIGSSGFKTMKDGAFQDLLLSTSTEPATYWKEYDWPISKPSTRYWSYDFWTLSRTCMFIPVSGALRIRLVDLELDGNLENNLGPFTKRGPSLPGVEHLPGGETSGIYAYGFTQEAYFWNLPTHGGLVSTTQSNRIVVDQARIELHNVSIHGFVTQCFLSSPGWYVHSTGVLELGDTPTGHWGYTIDGVYEHLRCFGYCSGDGLRMAQLNVKAMEVILYPAPDVFFDLDPYPGKHPTDPNSIGSIGSGDLYRNPFMDLITGGDIIPQSQSASYKYPYPELSKHRWDIGNLFIDASGLDDHPADESITRISSLFSFAGDNLHVGSGKIRLPISDTSYHVLFSTGGNSPGGHPFRNNIIENLQIEYGPRSGVQLIGGLELHQAQFRNISLEPRAASRGLNAPSPGLSLLLGVLNFAETIPDESPNNQFSDGGRFVDFGQTSMASVISRWIDISLSVDTAAPKFRVWFNITGGTAATAPSGTGVTLIPVTIANTATMAQLAAAFAVACEANASFKSHFTVATSGTAVGIGAWLWPSDFPLIDVSHAHAHTGITYKGEVKDAAQLALKVSAPPALNDAWVVIYSSSPITYPLAASRLWKWTGAAFADQGVFDGVVAKMAQSRRNYEPSVINFERLHASDPVYQYLATIYAVGMSRDVTLNFRECMLGAVTTSYITGPSGNGSFGTAFNAEMRDRLHFNFDGTVFDIRDSGGANLDLLLYCGRFNGCRVRTPTVATGLTTLGSGYEMLVSEQSGSYSGTPGAGVTTIDIQTKLFWVPKDGNVRIYPANAATAVVWNTNMPSVEWRTSSRPVGGGSSTLVPGAFSDPYYSVSDDRRAPVLRLNFATAPATALKIGWSAAVSP